MTLTNTREKNISSKLVLRKSVHMQFWDQTELVFVLPPRFSADFQKPIAPTKQTGKTRVSSGL